jgi:phosphatidylserine decarboxylase
MAPIETVRYFDRATGRIEEEQRADAFWLHRIYGGGIGSRLLRGLLRRRLVNRWMAWCYDRPASPKRLAAFISRWQIDAQEAERPWTEYRTLNDFFARRLRRGARVIDPNPDALLSPADARLLVYPEYPGGEVPLKGGAFTLAELIGDPGQAARFVGGGLGLFRLAPMDYHRFHFPADGLAEPARTIDGHLDSVSPVALRRDPKLLCTNRRDVVLLKTVAFGEILIVPVGAMAVGTVVETYAAGPVARGDEQGYFCYGGSSVVLLVQAGRVVFDADLVERSREGLETRVRMGERVGLRRR